MATTPTALPTVYVPQQTTDPFGNTVDQTPVEQPQQTLNHSESGPFAPFQTTRKTHSTAAPLVGQPLSPDECPVYATQVVSFQNTREGSGMQAKAKTCQRPSDGENSQGKRRRFIFTNRTLGPMETRDDSDEATTPSTVDEDEEPYGEGYSTSPSPTGDNPENLVIRFQIKNGVFHVMSQGGGARTITRDVITLSPSLLEKA